MTLVIYKVIAALLIFLVSIATALYPLKKKNIFQHGDALGVGESIASGIFLGAAFFHMLPDSIKLFSQVYGPTAYPVPEVVAMMGFLLLLFLERLSFLNTRTNKNPIPYILTIILIIHALVEGAALGIGSTFSEAVMIFIAITAHKGSESFALSMTLLRHALPFGRILAIVVLFSLMTPLGIGIGTLINSFTYADHGKVTAALFNAFAAGSFLYIATLHHIRFHKHVDGTQGLMEFLFLVMGASIMAVIALWA